MKAFVSHLGVILIYIESSSTVTHLRTNSNKSKTRKSQITSNPRTTPTNTIIAVKHTHASIKRKRVPQNHMGGAYRAQRMEDTYSTHGTINLATRCVM